MVINQTDNAVSYTIGGKAKGLYRLKKAGIEVPDFLVIPAETFSQVLSEAPASGAGFLAKYQELTQFDLSQTDQEVITNIITNWGFPATAVAVRSSIADEDGEQDAFPGIMDSFLNLTSLEAVCTAVAACAASAFSERALAYRQQKKLTLAARPAVIIQQQIYAEVSGVLFTTFPEYPQELAIHAVWSLGEGLVNGTLEPDEFYFLKSSGQQHRRKIATKETQISTNGSAGTRIELVSANKQNIACLTPTQLNKLFELGSYLEKSFNQPQDIEFVVKGDEVLLVQARPITQPIPEVVVYDNSNIQESYCGVTTPLTFSFAQRAYATVYRQTMQALGLPAATIQAQETVVTQLLGLVKGRIYYNINNWYRGLQLLPAFKQNKADMERMMGLEDPVDFVQDREKTISQKLQMLPLLALNLIRLLRAFAGLKKRVAAFQKHFQDYYNHFYSQMLHGLSVNELLQQREILNQKLLRNWTTPIINDFYVMMTNGQVLRKLRKAGVTETEEFLSRYLSGDQQIESTQPTKAMQALAVQAADLPDLSSLIIALPSDLHQQVEKLFPNFYTQVNLFISQYGDRTVGELKLETQTMRVEPLIFYKYLRNFLTSDRPLSSLTTGTSTLHQAASQELEALLQRRSFIFRKSVWRTLGSLQQAIRYREAMRLERTRLFGMYRALYRAIGEKLVQANQIATTEDIFYLTEEEITFLLLQEKVMESIKLVQDRKLEFAQYKKEEVPARVIIPLPPTTSARQFINDSDQLQGTGCFPGVVAGEVMVITELGGNLDVAGKIVAALRTDPGWAALFPNCKGVLIEKGSSLSHSVILLRELGIPTIINIPGLTKTLKTGQQISINGSTGEIQIIKQQHDTADSA